MRFSRPLLILGSLIAVAALQYHWVGEVSRAERVRLNNLLAESRKAFAEEMDLTLTRLAIMLLVSPDPREPIGSLPENFKNWRDMARWPDLVQDLYLFSRTHDGETETQRLDWAGGSPAPATLPASLQASAAELITHLEERHQRGNSRTRQQRGRRGRGGWRRGPLVDVIGAPPHFRIAAPAERDKATYLFVELNRAELFRKILPELAGKHFSEEYIVSVVRASEPETILFQNQPGAPTSSTRNAVPFFGLRYLPKLHEMPGLPAEMRRADITPETFRRGGMGLMRILGPAMFENRDGANGDLLLLVNHRSGSLETVLARARRNNLLISTGILAILGVTLILMIRSAERGKQLAHRQLEFVAGISHELMTPLAGIRSAAQNLAEGVIKEDTKIRRYGNLIESESRRLTTMVEKVLDYAGIQAGRREYDLSPIGAGELVSEGLDHCRTVLESAGFTLERRIAEDLPVVNADRTAFTRVVQNLVGNAIKYAAEAAWLRVSVTATADRVLIDFTDKGPGIPKADLANIFEPFFRGKEHVASNISGSGLGLCLVKHIVEGHRGKITVDSSAEGTTFHISLPVCR
ncbi:MAG: HAMP domain-containing sensor histidine kinase [Acidobacteriota bacterium]|nr:HAMP domain-containing sensor histidine kinase [Acidobacteriota bacterium]